MCARSTRKKSSDLVLFKAPEPDYDTQQDPATRLLPMTKEEMEAKGWDELDVVIVTGDAYVDHPCIAASVIGRCLEREGFKVGVVAQPAWSGTEDFLRMGQPKLFCYVTAGNKDSMLARLTVHKKLRSRDPYSPGGKVETRPRRASIVYANRARECYPDVPIVLGGVEADLRRFAYYDLWEDGLRRSILLDSRADLLVCGMGELSVLEVARRLAAGKKLKGLRSVPGLAYITEKKPGATRSILLPSFEDVRMSKKLFNEAFKTAWENYGNGAKKDLVQPTHDCYVVVKQPARPLTTEEMDQIYALPYTRAWHPSYDAEGGVPILNSLRFHIVTHRGCYAGCNFCVTAVHQGSAIQSRSKESIVEEGRRLAEDPEFRGTITDLSGPVANMYGTSCKKKRGRCAERGCLVPDVCPELEMGSAPLKEVLDDLHDIPGVKEVTVCSELRFDMLLKESEDGSDGELLKCLCERNGRRRLMVAPQHCCDDVLKVMNMPAFEVYERFWKRFSDISKELGKRQQLSCWWMTAHPGCELENMVELAEYFRDHELLPERVQDYYPAPLTISACVYYTGYHPITGEQHYVPATEREKLLQRSLLHFRDPRNDRLVRSALGAARATHLIGREPQCLLPLVSRASPPKHEDGREGAQTHSGAPKPSASERAVTYRPSYTRPYLRPTRPPSEVARGITRRGAQRGYRPGLSPPRGRPASSIRSGSAQPDVPAENRVQTPPQETRPPAPPKQQRASRRAPTPNPYDSGPPKNRSEEPIDEAPEFYRPSRSSRPERRKSGHGDDDSRFNREIDQNRLRPLSYRNYPNGKGGRRNRGSRK